MNKRTQSQLFITLDDLVAKNHPYRGLDELLSFDELSKPYHSLYSTKGRKKRPSLWLALFGFTIYRGYQWPRNRTFFTRKQCGQMVLSSKPW